MKQNHVSAAVGGKVNLFQKCNLLTLPLRGKPEKTPYLDNFHAVLPFEQGERFPFGAP